ncbi:MAG: hypothetical protein DRO04_02970, partial [Candidatus Iainarchaeum archaeon]
KNEYDVCTFISAADKRDSCYKALALKNNAYFICEYSVKTVSGISDRDICVKELALQKNDADLCKKIRNTEMKDDCILALSSEVLVADACREISNEEKQRKCYWNSAFKAENAEYCMNLPIKTEEEDYNGFNRDNCIVELAKEIQNIEICYLASDEDVKEECILSLVEVVPDKNACLKIKNKNRKNSCLFSVASQLKEASICDEIDKKFYAKLWNECYRIVAEDTLNLSYCDILTDEEIKGRCYGGVISKTAEYDKCKELKPLQYQTEQPHKARDYCYYELAVDKGEYRFCDEIWHDRTKGYCYGEVNYNKSVEDESVSAGTKCNELEGISKDYCLKKSAELSKDEGLCSNIEDGSIKGTCYVEVAKLKLDTSICNNLTLAEEKAGCFNDVCSLRSDKDDCLKNAAVSAKIKIACNYIEDVNKKQDCLDAIP